MLRRAASWHSSPRSSAASTTSHTCSRGRGAMPPRSQAGRRGHTTSRKRRRPMRRGGLPRACRSGLPWSSCLGCGSPLGCGCSAGAWPRGARGRARRRRYAATATTTSNSAPLPAAPLMHACNPADPPYHHASRDGCTAPRTRGLTPTPTPNPNPPQARLYCREHEGPTPTPPQARLYCREHEGLFVSRLNEKDLHSSSIEQLFIGIPHGVQP